MHGMYVNVDPGNVQTSLLCSPRTASFRQELSNGDVVTVRFHAADWPQGPIYTDDRQAIVAIAAGWFIYDHQFNDLAGIAQAIAATLRDGAQLGSTEWSNRLQGGNFLIYLHVNGKSHLITDLFGLFPHYVLRDASKQQWQVAPSPAFIAGSLERDPFLSSILKAQGHLFGDDTAFRNINRLTPGSIHDFDQSRRYYDYTLTSSGAAEEFSDLLVKQLSLLANRKWLLPLSGGLDSRLLLASALRAREGRLLDYGYTFGPRDSGDRPIARRFYSDFSLYDEFSLMELQYDDRFKAAAKSLFEATCEHPLHFLLAVNQRIHHKIGEGFVCLDGYAGDVLQRGIYLHTKGASDVLPRVVPSIFRRHIQPPVLLRRRYSHLNPQQFDYLMQSFHRHTDNLALDAAHKVVFFELNFGRGARHVLNGGTTMARQFFTVIQPFLFTSAFQVLFNQPHLEWSNLHAVQRVWRSVPERFRGAPTCSGIAINKAPWRSRLRATWVSIARKVGLARRMSTYEDELKATSWRRD